MFFNLWIQLNWPQKPRRMFTLQHVSNGRLQTVRRSHLGKWSSAEAKPSAAGLAPSLSVLHCPLAEGPLTAGNVWQERGWKPRPPAARSENSPLSHRFVRFIRSFTSASALRGSYCLGIQEGCQDAQKVRLPEVYHFCNIFKHTVRAMGS